MSSHPNWTIDILVQKIQKRSIKSVEINQFFFERSKSFTSHNFYTQCLESEEIMKKARTTDKEQEEGKGTNYPTFEKVTCYFQMEVYCPEYLLLLRTTCVQKR